MPLKHSVEEIKLKNGARGLLIDTPGSTSVFYNVHFRAGTKFAVDPTKSQVAHIMEHLSFGANKKYPTPESFSRDFSKHGAYHNALTSNIDMMYYVNAAVMEWDRILDLHLLAIAEPTYTQAALKAEKGNVSEEMAGYATNHGRILWQEIRRNVQLQRWCDQEEIKTIKAVELNDIKEHFNRTHTTANMRFVFSGDLKKHKADIITRLENIKLERGKQLLIPKETAQPSGPVFISRKDLPTLTFSLAFFLNRPLSHDEERTLGVLCYVLTNTFHSRIFGEARKRGICYGMEGDYESSPTGVSELTFDGQVTFENATELFQLMADELNDVRKNGITDDELQQAKEYKLGWLQQSNETVASLAGWYGEDYYEKDSIDYIDDMPKRIAKTTSEDVRKLLNEFLDANLWTLGGIGNSTPKKFAAYYEFFAKNITNKTIQ